MAQSASRMKQEQALLDRPHLAFVIECLGLAALAENSPHQELLTRLGRCLQKLFTTYAPGEHAPGTPEASLALWLVNAMQEFNCLHAEDISPLLQACSGNTMPEWLKDKARTELGEALTDLIKGCLEC